MTRLKKDDTPTALDTHIPGAIARQHGHNCLALLFTDQKVIVQAVHLVGAKTPAFPRLADKALDVLVVRIALRLAVKKKKNANLGAGVFYWPARTDLSGSLVALRPPRKQTDTKIKH